MSDSGDLVPHPAGPKGSAPSRATIHDVARRAGVSTSTVSRSLSGEPRVSEKTRARIRAIADELGYRPSRSAQALRLARTGTIGLLAPNLENPISYDHLRAVVRAAYEVGYTVLVGDGQDSPEIQDAELARMRDYRVDGLIIGRGLIPVTRALVDFVHGPIPVEPAFTESDLELPTGTRINAYSNTTSDMVGATIGYRRLARLGHRKFALFMLEHAAIPSGRQRDERLIAVLEDEGVPAASVQRVLVPTPEDCIAAVQTLMASDDAPTAIVSANGRITPYVLEGIHSAGLTIPHDVSFMSFGDSQWHRAYSPPISVVREDYAAVAQAIIDRLVARIAGAELPPAEVRATEFVMRSSIGPAPERGQRPMPVRPRTALGGGSHGG